MNPAVLVFECNDRGHDISDANNDNSNDNNINDNKDYNNNNDDNIMLFLIFLFPFFSGGELGPFVRG